MCTATLSTKGRLVIPNRLRKALRLQPGDKVLLTIEGEKLILQRDTPRRARLAQGKSGRLVSVAACGVPNGTTLRIKPTRKQLLESARAIARRFKKIGHDPVADLIRMREEDEDARKSP